MLQGSCAAVYDGTTITDCINAQNSVAIACAPPPMPPVNQPNLEAKSTAKAMEYIKL
jgi:hypothetical protein